MQATPFGFRIFGDVYERRRLVDHAAAFGAYANCDTRANVESEAYLSAFTFADDFRVHLESTGSTRDFPGGCCSPWLWIDIDRDVIAAALADARRLAVVVDERYKLADDDLLTFFSGSKGFHLGIATTLWKPEPSPTFHRVARRLAEGIAAHAGVAIDAGIYDRVRAFRAPNSRHPKTGLHKRRFTLDELVGLSADKIVALSATPEPFDVPTPTATSELAAADWRAAARLVEQESEGNARRRAETNGTPKLNRQTLEFIRDAATVGDRHRLLFSAAANLAEFDCPPSLAHALLSESALDSGLSPSDVRRQIECGLDHAKGAANA